MTEAREKDALGRVVSDPLRVDVRRGLHRGPLEVALRVRGVGRVEQAVNV